PRASVPARLRRHGTRHAQPGFPRKRAARRGAGADAVREVPVLLRRVRATGAVLPRRGAVPPGAVRLPAGRARRRADLGAHVRRQRATGVRPGMTRGRSRLVEQRGGLPLCGDQTLEYEGRSTTKGKSTTLVPGPAMRSGPARNMPHASAQSPTTLTAISTAGPRRPADARDLGDLWCSWCRLGLALLSAAGAQEWSGADCRPPRASVTARASRPSSAASSQVIRGSRRNQDSWRRAKRLVAFTVSSRAWSSVQSPSR